MRLYFFISVTRQLSWNLNPFNLNCRCSSFERRCTWKGLTWEYWTNIEFELRQLSSLDQNGKKYIGSGSLPCILFTPPRLGITICHLSIQSSSTTTIYSSSTVYPFSVFLSWLITPGSGCTVCNMLVTCTLSLLIHLLKLLNLYFTHTVSTLHQLSTLVDPPTRIRLNSVWQDDWLGKKREVLLLLLLLCFAARQGGLEEPAGCHLWIWRYEDMRIWGYEDMRIWGY